MLLRSSRETTAPQGPPEFSAAWFDASSAAWLANKRKLKNCCYRYTCGYTIGVDKLCKRDVFSTERMLCRQHYGIWMRDEAAARRDEAKKNLNTEQNGGGGA